MTIHEFDAGYMTFGPEGDQQVGETHLTPVQIEYATHYGQMVGAHALGMQIDELHDRLAERSAAGAGDAELSVIQNELDFATFALRIAPQDVADFERPFQKREPQHAEQSAIPSDVDRLVAAFRRANVLAAEKIGADPANYANSHERAVAEGLGNDLAAARNAAKKTPS